ncbi:Cna B-type domain-containing protein [Berryella wangjianweii]|uniref:Cna B-type domain-containing protein n=1 Tax=Berryella wangjianweii TaxID=2734634 RepID=A0A6M8J4C7_9ACTN|nr:Cna B-type domain-containing protein [Berryella wangjianweii]QKF06836.1 Cna B-type domain-containing protein [Berryella wangjianweii]
MAVLALVIGTFVLIAAKPEAAHADDRRVVDMTRISGLLGSDEDLQRAIDEAGSTPTRIILCWSDTMLSRTIVIPEGADIELVNHVSERLGTQSRLVRSDGFTGTLISVRPNAKLTMTLVRNEAGEGDLVVHSRGQWVPSENSTIQVRGTLVLDGAVVSGARELNGIFCAAVTVTGPGSRLEMNSGAISDNERSHLDPSVTQAGAGNVAVLKGGTFVLNGGSISHGAGGSAGSFSVGEAGGVGVYEGGHFIMNGGTISDNVGWGGGIAAYNWVGGADIARWVADGNADERSRANRALIEINGGTISNNRSGYGGGGLQLFGNVEAVMTGGVIEGNHAGNGGGVNAMDLYTWGDDYRRETPAEGVRSGLSTDEYSRYQPGGFRMTGGAIRGNWAQHTGGGVNAVSNRVVLEGGEISGNEAVRQGGGLYVATKTYTAHLYDSAVYDNAAEYAGGGLWTCPTGKLTTYVTRGTMITANRAADRGDDIGHINLRGIGAYPMSLADRVLGGAPVTYYWDSSGRRYDPADPGDPVILRGGENDLIEERGLHSVVSDEGVALGKESARLRIFGNTANLGGGIGTNGGVVFGEPDVTQLRVDKTWLYEGGDDPVPDEAVPADSIEAEVSITLRGHEYRVERMVLSRAEGWTRVIENLPVRDADGEELNVSVREVGEGGAAGVVAVPDPQHPGVLKMVNRVKPAIPAIDVTATKAWVGGETLGPRPTVWLRLYRALEGGRPEPVPGAAVEELADGVASVTWAGIERVDASGRPYAFSAREVDAEGGDFVPAGYEKSEDGLTVTNTYVPPTAPPTPPEPPEPPAPSTPPANPPKQPDQPRPERSGPADPAPRGTKVSAPATGEDPGLLTGTVLCLMASLATMRFAGRARR